MPEYCGTGGESVTVAGKSRGGKLEQTVGGRFEGDWTPTFKNPGFAGGLLPARCRARPVRRKLTFTLVRGFRESAAQLLVLDRQLQGQGFPLTVEADDHGWYRATAMFRRATLLQRELRHEGR